MKTSAIASALAKADNSPVVTPAQLIAFGNALLTEIQNLLASTPPPATPAQKLKAYSTIADLNRATGLSRERICRIVNKHPEIRTITSDTYSYFRRIHTQDFLTTIQNLATPNPH